MITPQLVKAEKVIVTTSPENARIYVDGVLKGTGKIQVTIPRKECITVEVRLEGFVQEIRTYCNKKHESTSQKDYIRLQEDLSLKSSTPSDFVNNEIQLTVKATKTREEAWRMIVSTVLNRFEELDLNDERAGYLRTSWISNPFDNNTVRIKIIIRQTSDDPLTYKIKFLSEESGKAGTPVNNADGLYKPFNRMLKKNDGFIEELMTRLKN
jgi:hypothetical protein